MRTYFPSIVDLAKPIMLTLCWGLAFLPAIIHLARRDFPVTNPLVALGPVAAGFLFAARLSAVRLSFVLLGAVFTSLLWAINWLMLAGHDCCSFPN